MNIPFLMLK